MLERVKYIMLEVAKTPRYLGEPMAEEIIQTMRKSGYEMAFFDRNFFIEKQRTSVESFDVVFKRKESRE